VADEVISLVFVRLFCIALLYPANQKAVAGFITDNYIGKQKTSAGFGADAF
jgi:hypothetical protein